MNTLAYVLFLSFFADPQISLPSTNPECVSRLDRLSLRKRKIVRSPYPQSMRKRVALNHQKMEPLIEQSPSPILPPVLDETAESQSSSPVTEGSSEGQAEVTQAGS